MQWLSFTMGHVEETKGIKPYRFQHSNLRFLSIIEVETLISHFSRNMCHFSEKTRHFSKKMCHFSEKTRHFSEKMSDFSGNFKLPPLYATGDGKKHRSNPHLMKQTNNCALTRMRARVYTQEFYVFCCHICHITP